jgi:DNA modification methylase
MDNKENTGGDISHLVDSIICGNCADLMADLLPDDCIDLTVTSPPY